MGNGPGDVWVYNELFDKYPKLIGGCIWEWADHVVTEKGVEKYGGDFDGELTNDGNFCCDGVVFANRSFKAGSLEVKAAYQPIRTNLSNGKLTIFNRLDFTNLNEYEFVYSLEADGEVFKTEKIVLDIEPHGEMEIHIEIPQKKCKFGYHLNISLFKNGKECAKTQHTLPFEKITERVQNSAGFTEDERNIYIVGKRFSYIFSKHYGNFTSLVIDGEEQLCDRVKISAFRAPADNDRNIKVYWANINVWQGENLDCAFNKIYSCDLKNEIISVKGALAGVSRLPLFKYDLNIGISDNGTIAFEFKAEIRDEAFWLPRLGFEFELPEGNNNFSYYAAGPIESYCDMNHWASVGLYESNTEKEYVNYVMPQEHGNHFSAKMIKIGNMVFTSDCRFEFNVSKYSALQLYKATHTDELKADGKTHLRVDYKVSGLGSGSCGPELEEKYRLSEKDVKFTFILSPV